MQYTQDHDEAYPTPWYYNGARGVYWAEHIFPYVRSNQIFICPSGTKPNATFDIPTATGMQFPTLGMNNVGFGTSNNAGGTLKVAKLRRPTEFIMVTDCTDNGFVGYNDRITERHFEGANIGFADGHIKWEKKDFYEPDAAYSNWPKVLTRWFWQYNTDSGGYEG